MLGLHAIKDRPVAVNGKIEIRPVRPVLFSFFMGKYADVSPR